MKTNLNLNHLLNFIQIIEWGNISKAAAFLNIAQPALSRQIKSLEDTMGTHLMQRHSWGIEPTEDGKRLLQYALRIQKECIAAQESMQSSKDNPTGTVYFGVPSAYSVTLVPPLLERMSMLYPNISVRIVEAFSATIYEWLISGRLDLAILYYSKEYNVADTTPFVQEEMHAYSTEEMIAGKDEFPLAELGDRKLILPWRPHMLRLEVESAFITAAIPFEPSIEIDSMPCLKELAHRGDGVTILPPSSVARETADGRLHGVPLRPSINLVTVLGQTPIRQPTRAVSILSNTLSNLAHELAPMTGWTVTAK